MARYDDTIVYLNPPIVLRWLYTRSVLTNDLHLVPEIEYELALVCLSTTLGRCLKRIRWRIQSKRRRHVNNSRYTAINVVESHSYTDLVLSTVTVDSYFLQGNSQQFASFAVNVLRRD